MSRELVNRITIKKDGVYLSTHSSNDTNSFHSHRIETLSKIFFAEGQLGLDREIIKMVFEYVELKGSHKSVIRYKNFLGRQEVKDIYKKYLDLINNEYDNLTERDISTLFYKPTPAAKKFNEFEENTRNQMYMEMARLLEGQ